MRGAKVLVMAPPVCTGVETPLMVAVVLATVPPGVVKLVWLKAL